MRISDWSSDVCSSDLRRLDARGDERARPRRGAQGADEGHAGGVGEAQRGTRRSGALTASETDAQPRGRLQRLHYVPPDFPLPDAAPRSEEHTSELQSLMRISYAVFCLKKKKKQKHTSHTKHHT